MEYTIKQHVPGFFDVGNKRRQAQFETYDELIVIPFVEGWMHTLDDKQFLYLAYDKYTKDSDILMGIWDNYHWVIGFIYPPLEIDFPLKPWNRR